MPTRKTLAERLINLGEKIPYIWCTLGHSGEEIAVLAGALPDKIKSKIQIVPINYDRDNKAISFQDRLDDGVFKNDAPVLIIDSSVHSGNTMLAAFKKIT